MVKEADSSQHWFIATDFSLRTPNCIQEIQHNCYRTEYKFIIARQDQGFELVPS